MADPDGTASAHLSRYDAMLRLAQALGTQRTIAELFHVLAEQLHALIPFDYLALLLHEEQGSELRLVVLEPVDLEPPFLRKPIADYGPAATVWETQRGAVIPIPDEGPLPIALTFLRNHGRKMTAWLPLTTPYRRVGVLAFGSCSAVPYT